MIYNIANQENAFSKAEKEQLNNDITNLKNNKADETDLNALTNRVSAAESNINNLSNNKANQSDLNVLINRVNTTENNINNKADETDLNALTNRVSTAESNINNLSNNKANQLDLINVTNRVNTAESNINNLSNNKADKWNSTNGFNAGSNYQLMDAKGMIPNERLNILDSEGKISNNYINYENINSNIKTSKDIIFGEKEYSLLSFIQQPQASTSYSPIEIISPSVNMSSGATYNGTYQPKKSGYYRVFCVGAGGYAAIGDSDRPSTAGYPYYGGGGGAVSFADFYLDENTQYNWKIVSLYDAQGTNLSELIRGTYFYYDEENQYLFASHALTQVVYYNVTTYNYGGKGYYYNNGILMTDQVINGENGREIQSTLSGIAVLGGSSGFYLPGLTQPIYIPSDYKSPIFNLCGKFGYGETHGYATGVGSPAIIIVSI